MSNRLTVESVTVGDLILDQFDDMTRMCVSVSMVCGWVLRFAQFAVMVNEIDDDTI